VSPYAEDGVSRVGGDPRKIPLIELRRLRVREHMTSRDGFQPVVESPIKAIRAKCVDCSGGSFAEVRKCVATAWPLWPFRMGRNPFHGKGDRKFDPDSPVPGLDPSE
jgi:hypothetical protein